MTNFHVIDECIEGRGKVSIALLYEKNQEAEILDYDKRNDLAALTTDIEIPPLELSKNELWPGYWVMALGSAASYEGSVAFGNVLNITVENILITNNVSQGNSGGPLVDNEGKVVGMVTWQSDVEGDQFNGALIS